MQDRMRDELAALARHRGGPCLSVFLPTSRSSAEAAPAARLERLLAAGAQRLLSSGSRETSVEALLAAVRDAAAERAFWGSPLPGLAILAAPGMLRTYRLPYSVGELVVAGARFHLKPLLALLEYGAPFYVLALSKNRVRLLRCAWDAAEPVALPGAPTSLADSLKYDDFEPQRQVHPGAVGRTGGHGAVFYGHGAVAETAKGELQRYCQQVAHSVRRALHAERAPLVLAGVGYLLAIYRAAGDDPATLADAVTGNPDKLGDEELRARAWPLVSAARGRRLAEAIERYRTIAATHPQRASAHLRTIVPAAAGGRVESLIVAGDREEWGAFDEATGVLTTSGAAQSGEGDLLDLAAALTLLHAGEVHVAPAAELPSEAPVVAILRSGAPPARER